MGIASYTAKRVLEELGITSPNDLRLLEEIAWMRGALVNDGPLTGAEARLTVRRNKAIITISSNVHNPHRRRFSIAHELGHFELHRSSSALSMCLSEDIDDALIKVGKKLEQDANEFASALLLPEHFFQPLCNEEDPSIAIIENLADQFSTSLTATACRYIEFSEEPVAIVCSEENHIKWVFQSNELKEFGVFINSRRKLDIRSIAARSSGRKRVAANAWFDEGEFDRDASIIEDSRQLPNYNAVITLLWVDESLTSDEEY